VKYKNERMISNMEELKECPFCKGKGEIWSAATTCSYQLYQICCSFENCKIQTPKHTNIDYLVNIWNRRRAYET
jgi:hypothetical protein